MATKYEIGMSDMSHTSSCFIHVFSCSSPCGQGSKLLLEPSSATPLAVQLGVLGSDSQLETFVDVVLSAMSEEEHEQEQEQESEEALVAQQ